jgi:predicted transcriptional regulator
MSIGTAKGRARSLTDLACEVAAAYVSHNHVAAADLPTLITDLRVALSGLSGEPRAEVAEPASRPTPGQIRRSVTPDALISFIDGKPYKTLKRHLTKHGLTPDAYCARYGLPEDYPMVASAYSKRRSALARDSGLGSANRTRGKRKT